MNTTSIYDPSRCQYCGNFHTTVCPRVKAIEYDGAMIKRVEFFAPNEYPQFDMAKWPLAPHPWCGHPNSPP
jgi:hypothetical protein